jgi:HAD superfamily hydrolase (TIGR01509 family)
MSLKALIFDVDGTLADTERTGHRVAYNRTFAQYGLTWLWSEETYGILLAVTGGKERMRYYLERFDPPVPADADIDSLIAELYDAKTAVFREMLESGSIPLRPGVSRLLDEARQAGLRLAIATTTAPSNVQYLLTSNLGQSALSWFDVIAAGDIVAHKKPSPEIYQLVLDETGWHPSQCVAFEDSENGVLAASDAGLPVIVTITEYTREENFERADLVLTSLGDTDQGAEIIIDRDDDFSDDLLTVDYLISRFS